MKRLWLSLVLSLFLAACSQNNTATSTPTPLLKPPTVKGLSADGGKAIRPVAGVTVPPHIEQGPPKVGASGWYIRPYRTIDTGQDISGIINTVSGRNGIWPVYTLAVVMAESGGATGYASERFAVYPDWSCGLMQQIIPNVTAYTGITDTRQACNWEEVPANSIGYGTFLLHQYMQMTGVGYPGLWQCYNAGPGSCRSPYYGAFLTHYYIALTYATSGPTPPPPPPHPRPTFSLKRWCAYATVHHTACVSHLWHGKLSWAASVWVNAQHYCGGVVHKDVFYPPGRGNVGFSATRFQRCKIFQWNKYRTAKVARARLIR